MERATTLSILGRQSANCEQPEFDARRDGRRQNISMAALIAPASPKGDSVLTQRELQVLSLVAEGKSDIEVGREIFVTADTVKSFLRSIYRKLGARNRTQAVALAIRSNLI